MSGVHARDRKSRIPYTDIDDKIRDMRTAGMSCRAISLALCVLCGWHMTEGQVRYRCDRFDWPRGGMPYRPRRRAG